MLYFSAFSKTNSHTRMANSELAGQAAAAAAVPGDDRGPSAMNVKATGTSVIQEPLIVSAGSDGYLHISEQSYAAGKANKHEGYSFPLKYRIQYAGLAR